MNLEEALEIAVSQTQNDRFRFLCSDGNPDTEQREAYRSLVFRIATEVDFVSIAPKPNPASSALLAEAKAAAACRHRIKPETCGCQYGKCSKYGNKELDIYQCIECRRNGLDG